MRRHASPTIHVTAFVLVTIVLFAIVGAWLARTEIVARGTGRIISSLRTQSIQSRFDGMVLEIRIREGQRVRKDETLILLDSTAAQSDLDLIDAELERQRTELCSAVLVLRALDKMPANKAHDPEACIELGNRSVADSLSSAATAAIYDEAEQNRALQQELTAARSTQLTRIRSAQSELIIVRQQNEPIERLLRQGTISRSTYLKRKGETQLREHEFAVAQSVLEEINARLFFAKKQGDLLLSSSVAKHRKLVSDAELSISSLSAQRVAAENVLNNTMIRSPADGRVENLEIHTLGSFVASGRQLMQIVPENGDLEIEAFFPNHDAGFLRAGQRAFIKLDAFPAQRFGYVTGIVYSVGADARKIDEDGGWVYAVRIRPDARFVEQGGKRHFLIAGMTGSIDVVTGERRLLAFFFEPVIKAIQDGLGER